MKHKVLCIDDENHNLEALERLLRKTYQVVTAASGAEALKELEQHQFSLIISDQKMPQMTGVEFFMEARKQQPEAIRILLTGYTDLESVIDAINQGQIYRYITKPWEPEEFLSTTKQAIEVFEMKSTIREQNEQLKKANEALQSLDQLKTDFMMLVNHELKTPLTGIFSYVQLLGEESLNEDQALYIKKIGENTQRLQELINDTLLITRLKSESKDQSREETDLAEIIESQWQALSPRYSKKNLTLKLDSAQAFVQNVNKAYILTVIEKLLKNCLQHAKSDSEVQFRLEETENEWRLTAENTSAKPLTKTPEALLDPFSTSEALLNHSGGTGLGLAVIQAIVDLFSASLNLSIENEQFRVEIGFPKN